MNDAENTEPRRANNNRANRNPWYCLATVYGEQPDDWKSFDKDLAAKNRMAWNRWTAVTLGHQQRADLVSKGFSKEELEPLSAYEESVFRGTFVSHTGREPPDPAKEVVDFTNVQFDGVVIYEGFLFIKADFTSAQFHRGADFSSATFSGDADFGSATFSGDNADFHSVTFSGDADFSSAKFHKGANFSSATFSRDANFGSATFSGAAANFHSATFSGDAYFSSATFSGAALFGSVTFSGNAVFNSAFSEPADFSSATFHGLTYFGSAEFFGHADFSSAEFSRSADFSSAKFSRFAFFNSAMFSENAYFGGTKFSAGGGFDSATFSGPADFGSAKFFGPAYFSSAKFYVEANFLNTEFAESTVFAGAHFESRVPDFRGAKMHEATEWHGVKWPPPPRNKNQAQAHVYAYERLKQEMERLKKHEDELKFFAFEMKSRQVLLGRAIPLTVPASTFAPSPRGLCKTIPPLKLPEFMIPLRPAAGLPIALYGFLCDYGRSYIRPLCGLLVTAIGGALAFWPHFGCHNFDKAMGVSVANTFGVLGFRKDFVSPETVKELSNQLIVIAGVQTVVGAILLFLFGLALRNRFRMR